MGKNQIRVTQHEDARGSQSEDVEIKTQWHPPFCQAVQLELKANKKDLSYESEHNLYSKPIQIDLLVIRKSSEAQIENEIGKLFRGHNIMEYKSPQDALNVDVYYKVLAYAFLYKSQGDRVDSIKADDLTISLVRESKPKKLLKWFEKNGYEVEPAYPGIYYVRKEGFPKTQVIVSRELKKEEHQWLRSLTADMEKEDAKQLVASIRGLQEEDEKRYADSILELVMKENTQLFDGLKKEDTGMCEALLELMKPELEEAKAKAAEEGRSEGLSQGRSEGLLRGLSQGRSEGLSQGLSQGLTQGVAIGIQALINTCQKLGVLKDDIVREVMKGFQISKEEAEENVEKYWKP